MPKDVRVILVEDDPYSRDLMAMLLTRDWRTRVVAEFGSEAEQDLKTYLQQPVNRADVIVIDTEAPRDSRWPLRIAQICQNAAHPPVVIYTCTRPDEALLSQLLKNACQGYIVKGEILYGLATAVTEAFAGRFPVTPGVKAAAIHLPLPADSVVLDGTVPVAHFTRRECDLLRLGVLFNHAQRDIADELVVSTGFVAELMGKVYEKLGIYQILSGEIPLETHFSSKKLLRRFSEAVSTAGQEAGEKKPRKGSWLSTLAYHLLTIPTREDVSDLV